MEYRYIPYIKHSIKLAIPIVVAQAGTQLASVADSIMVGRVGSIYIAAASMASSFYLIPLLFGMGSTIAITPLTGNANGRNDLSECKVLFSNAFFLQLANAVILTLLILAFGNIIPLLDPDTEKTALAHSFFNYLAISTFPLILFFVFRAYFDGFGFTAWGMVSVLGGNIVNIFLNWVFIYGNLGSPAMALDGAGLATLIARIFTFLLIVTLAFFVPKLRLLVEIPKWHKVQKQKILSFFKVGMHIGLQSSLEIASFSLIVLFCGWLGTASAAAYQITLNISGLCYLSTMGLSSAGTVIISNYYGAGDIKSLKDAAKSVLMLAFAFTFFCSVIIIVFQSSIAPLFINDLEVVTIATTLILMMGLFQIPDGLNVTMAGILRGVLDTKMPMVINSLAFWVVMIPLAYILGFIFDFRVYGVMFGVCIGIVICAIAIFFRFRWAMKRLKAK
ncbi:MAG: MATE family efflux transporter [Ignavibacteria bacterium]|jgi:MATE family multidrug resistance protein|nr:MATE family efflux transporter [Ignavibacteria bacterium]